MATDDPSGGRVTGVGFTGAAGFPSFGDIMSGESVPVDVLPGGLVYVQQDGVTKHWPDGRGWTPHSIPLPELAALRATLIGVLTKVENVLDQAGMLGRVTRGADQ